jgi:hypothetical protein
VIRFGGARSSILQCQGREAERRGCGPSIVAEIHLTVPHPKRCGWRETSETSPVGRPADKERAAMLTISLDKVCYVIA